MQVVFRVDASIEIGVGHLMRCLTLADALSKLGAEITFITRNHDGEMSDYIIQRGYQVHLLDNNTLPNNAYKDSIYDQWLSVDYEVDANQTIHHLKDKVDWLIVDHYALNSKWENLLNPHVKKILVIDDLANRFHNCDVLLDQTYGRQESDYIDLVPSGCRLMLGTHYALLRPDFSKLRANAINKRRDYSGIRRIMISVGGLDETNLSSDLLNIFHKVSWQTDIEIDIVLTSKAPHLNKIKQLLNDYPFKFNLHIDTNQMAQIMLEADLAIGSGGTTSWERCCMGLPTILIVLAENQENIGTSLMQAGATITLNENKNLMLNIVSTMNKLIKSKETYINLVNAATKICDGLGAERLAKEIYFG